MGIKWDPKRLEQLSLVECLVKLCWEIDKTMMSKWWNYDDETFMKLWWWVIDENVMLSNCRNYDDDQLKNLWCLVIDESMMMSIDETMMLSNWWIHDGE